MSIIVPSIIILTLLGYIGIGLWSAKKVNTSEGFLVAGGKLGLLPLTGTYVATFMSAVSVLGAPAGIYQNGLSYFWLLITFAIGACITVIVARKYKKVELTTPADFAKIRYQSSFLERLISGGSVVALLFSLMAQFTAMGIVWSMALNRSFVEGIIVTALAMMVIIASGGLMSVAWSDVLKCGIFLVAIVAVGGWVLVKYQGFTSLLTQAAAIKPECGDLTVGVGGVVGLIFLCLTWSCGIGTHPQYLQRISAAQDERTGILQYVLGWPLILLINIGLLVVGLAAIVSIPELPVGTTRDYIGPYFVMHNAPVVLYGLFLAGLMAAALSTADSVIQLSVSYVSHNLVRGYIKTDISDKALLRLSRVLSVLLVIFIAVAALFNWKWIVYIAAYCWGILAILYFAPTLLGLYWRRANRLGAIWSVEGGLGAFLFAQSLAFFGKWPFPEVPPTGVGVIAGMLLMIIVSLTTPPSEKEALKPFFPDI